MTAKERIIIAIDKPNLAEAEELARQVVTYVGTFKVGLELFTALLRRKRKLRQWFCGTGSFPVCSDGRRQG